MKRMSIGLIAVWLVSGMMSAIAAPIFDVTGRQLENHAVYHLIPKGEDVEDMGLIYASSGGEEDCPYSVVLAPMSSHLSKPVQISSRVKTATIYERLNVDITFHGAPECISNPSWSVVKTDRSDWRKRGIYLVKLSGFYEDTIEGWFQFKRYKNDLYKLLFIPDDEQLSTLFIRTVRDRGNFHLAATDDESEALLFSFDTARNHLHLLHQRA